MRLDEILNLQPLPYKWLSTTVGTFEFNNRLFGIVVEENNIPLINRVISIANITFGLVIDPQRLINVDNLDINPTNFGQPRTVMATVATACINNPALLQHDMLCIGAANQIAKREHAYLLATTEIGRKVPQYNQTYRVTMPNGSRLIIMGKVELTQEEVDKIGKEWLGK